MVAQARSFVTVRGGYDRINMAAASDVSMDDRQLTLISKALADPKRFEMLQRIGESGEVPNCSCLREWVGLSPATITHHLKELENASLIKVERQGKFAHLTFRRDVWKAYLRRLAEL